MEGTTVAITADDEIFSLFVKFSSHIFYFFCNKSLISPLDPDQLTAVVKKKDAGLPMYLSVACEELRVFGVFELLDDKIKDLPDDMKGLLKTVRF